MCLETIRVFIGTWGSYNSGNSIVDIKDPNKQWLDLEDYSNVAEFWEACRELHKREHDPEFMIQDHENAPEGSISESHIDPRLWEFLELDEYQQEIVMAYSELINFEYAIDNAQDNYQGTADSDQDFAQDYYEQCGEEIPTWVCVDWEGTWRSSLSFDFSSVRFNGENFYFRDQ